MLGARLDGGHPHGRDDQRQQDLVDQFEQYWSFTRHPQYGWVLDEIQQGEEAEYHLRAPIVNQDEGPRIYEQERRRRRRQPADP